MKKIIFSLCGLLLFISCSSENDKEDIIKSDNKDEIFKSTQKISNYHSKTLDVLYSNILESKKGNKGVLMNDGVNYNEFSSIDILDNSVEKLLASNLCNDLDSNSLNLIKNHYDLEKYVTSNNSYKGKEIVVKNLEVNDSSKQYISTYLKDKSNSKEKLHTEFINELSILKSISEESVKDLLFTKYSNLDDASFYELSIIGSTFLDSYNYWNDNLKKWEDTGFFDNENNEVNGISSRGYWSGVLRYANKDANGVSKMLVGAALFNAFSGGTGVVISGPALLIGAGISSAWPD